MATLRNPSGGTTLAHYRSSCLAAKPDRGACQSPAASNAFLVTYPSPTTRVRWRYPPEGAAERRYPALCTCWIFRASRRVLGTPCGVSRSRRRRAPAPHPRPPDVPSTPRAARHGKSSRHRLRISPRRRSVTRVPTMRASSGTKWPRGDTRSRPWTLGTRLKSGWSEKLGNNPLGHRHTNYSSAMYTSLSNKSYHVTIAATPSPASEPRPSSRQPSAS